MGNIPDDQIEIINDFIQESRDMLDNLEPTIIELGQSCQKVDCWSVLNCSNKACKRHGKSLETPCWLDEGYVGAGLQTCVFAEAESDCLSCQVFALTNGDPETMNAIFRLFHSMKGSAGFLEFDHIAHVAHLAENLLDRIRSGKVMLEADHVDLLCQGCDFAREALDYVEKNLDDQGVSEEAAGIGALLEKAVREAQQKAERVHAQQDDVAAAGVELETEASGGELPGLEDLITPEMLSRFVQEGDELLTDSEQLLLAWGEDPGNSDSLAELFRDIHSFKGNCGFFGFVDLEKLSHQMETVLDAAKQGCDFGDQKPADTLLKMVDQLRTGLGSIADGGRGELENLEDSLAEMKKLLVKTDQPPAPDPEELRLADLLVQQGVVASGTIATLMRTKSRPLVDALIGCEIATREQIDQAVKQAQKPSGGEKPAAEKRAPVAVKPVKAAKAVAGRAAKAAPKGGTIKRQDIRVDLDKLDKLINLIGEMVIAENMLVNNPDLVGLELENFNKASQQMSKIVRELQEMAMVIRMIPVSGLFRRMIRLVHDLSVKSGKKVELELSGEETEVDKTVIEQITDPLVHLLRNSLDHGLESPEERVAAGKPEKGVVRLSAKHEEGEVWITVEDDGRGLNRERILAKAIEKGLVQGDGAEMSDRAVFNLIFQPGFSTADKITDISGRGVGMDVVKQNLEKIKGKIEVYSKPGQGSSIKLRIPLTLAIIEGLMIRVGRTRCILPLLSVREIFRPTAEAITHTPDGQELVKVRENFVPVLRLHNVLRKKPDSFVLHEGTLVVLEHQDDRIGLFVDEILGQQQTVIKGLSNYLGNVNCASGCTILGNGDVCLILDVGSLVDVVEQGLCRLDSEPAGVEMPAAATA
ncbi:chemotaxis protein CheA [Geothermobacter hydrogeniphilus]|uniref:Chemotaxis protein CheA n=2 Tax=Geothermobacter hydrogeniphilus TaxID=1969733 RepID=A0A2K2HCU3_9BACT|nr:chemotaxis protein CheA [Geothermobacter hydrogeniphilus]